MSYSSEVLADSPLAWWRFSESSGSLADSSGNGKAITLSGPTQGTTGPFGSELAITFDGVNDTATSDLAMVSATDYTIEFWIKTTATTGLICTSRDNATPGLRVSLGAGPTGGGGDGRLVVGVSRDANWRGVSAQGAINDGSWHHVACVWDGASGAVADHTQFAVYVDGDARVTDNIDYSFGTTAPLSSGPFILGYKAEETGYFAGSLSNLAFYGTPLSASRAAAHYDATIVVPPTGTISGVLPGLAAGLSGGIEFSGTVAAVLPAIGANLAGTSLPPGVAGTLSATLPPLGGSLAGAYSDTATLAAVLPPLSAAFTGTAGPAPITGTLAATLPGLAANLAGSVFEPGTSGFLAAVLPALSASFSGDVLGRTGLGLALDSTAVLTVNPVLNPVPAVPAGTPSTVLHIIAPTVPVPTLVAGRPA